jgi:hypothetical protein
MQTKRAKLLAICALLALTSCGPRTVERITPAEAQAQIQAIYDRQDTGFAAKNVDDMFYHEYDNALVTDKNGAVNKAGDIKTTFGALFYHGSNLRSKQHITDATFTSKTATVRVSTRQTYTVINSNQNTRADTPESFADEYTSIDTWVLTNDGWWQTGSKITSELNLRNGQPYTPVQ